MFSEPSRSLSEDALAESAAADAMLPSLLSASSQESRVDVRSLHTIRTAENLEIEVELAGVGNRIFAFLLDAAMMGILSVLMMAAAAYSYQIDKDLPLTVFTAGGFIISYCYHFLQEWLWSGKTLGKYLLGIRVVRGNGQPIGLWESMGRNLFRIIDVMVSGIGLLPMLLSPSERRFGDFVVGTIVINDQRLERPPVSHVALDAEGHPLERPEGLDETLLTAGKRLNAQEYDVVQEYLTRSRSFRPAAQALVADELGQYFTQRLHMTPTQWGDDAPEASEKALTALYFGYRG